MSNFCSFFVDLLHFVVFKGEGRGLVFGDVSDILVDVNPLGQVDTLLVGLLHGLINLDDAGEGLSVDLLVEVKHHVDTVFDDADALGSQLVAGRVQVVADLDVLGG